MTEQNFFDYDAELAAKLAQFDQGEGVRLPFPVAHGYWLNGSAARKQYGGVPYLGGWAFDAENMDAVVDEIAPVPPTWNLLNLVGQSGTEFTVYATRWLGIATIASRQRWIKNPDSPDPKKGRTHLQLLSLVAVYEDAGKQYIPWGPVVLTAKGYASSFLQKAVDGWSKSTLAARKEHTGSLPAKLFYAPIGTFGKTPDTEKVGKGEQSNITPPRLHLPGAGDSASITLDYLKVSYVGRENGEKMLDWAEQAQEWLDEWRKGKSKADSVPPGTDDAAEDGFISF